MSSGTKPTLEETEPSPAPVSPEPTAPASDFSPDAPAPHDVGILLSDEQETFIDAVLNGPRNEHILLLGKAGVGKSTTTRELAARADKEGLNYIKCAPTGIAAINIGGMTVHRAISFFARNRAPIDFLLLDEVSMCRADLLDELNRAMMACYMSDDLFGGVKVALVGDPGQLPPVIKTGKNKDAESEYVLDNYLTPFFWSSNAYVQAHRKGQIRVLELTEVFRQKDPRFPKMLNLIRKGDWQKPCGWLNKFRGTNKPKGVVLLGTNADAAKMNEQMLRALPGEKTHFRAAITGEIKPSEYPTEDNIWVCHGARVMIVKNIYRETGKFDVNGRMEFKLELVNGDVGEVMDASDGQHDPGEGQCIDFACERTGEIHRVYYTDGVWTKEEATYDKAKKRLVKEVVGSFVQLPVRLAWAITIHKSQGATIEELTLDVRRPLFSPGQCYVALSRGVSLDKVHILGTLRPNDVKVDDDVIAFLNGYEAGVAIKPGSVWDGNQLELAMDTPKEGIALDMFDEGK